MSEMATQIPGVGEDDWGSPDTRPCFYKIIWLANKLDLRIPPAFKKHLLNEETDRATLRAASGVWQVRLLRDKVDIYFVEGWQEFVKHHSLGKGEFLLFKYNGGVSFDVVIYDINGCARNYQSVVSSHQESASSFTSSFPFFKFQIKNYNVGKKCILLIPTAFSRRHLPMCRHTVILRNLEGMSWQVSIICFNRNQLALSGGWKAFSDGNSIKKGDVCIFELVEQNVMKVHIFRS